jgi:hypothetical protein
MNRDHIRAGLNKSIDSTYQDTALWHARDTAASDHCAELMRDEGMYGLLRSTDLVKRTALLGLVAGLNSHRKEVNQAFRQHEYDLDDTLQELNKCWDRHGFPSRIAMDSDDEALIVPLI